MCRLQHLAVISSKSDCDAQLRNYMTNLVGKVKEILDVKKVNITNFWM